MRRFILLFAILLLPACSRLARSALLSPSGAYSVTTELSGDEAGPTRRLCVRLRFTSAAAKREITFQTSASDVQKWAIAWSPGDSLVLYSSDIGSYAYEIENGIVLERLANDQEQAVGRQAYEAKYGRKPSA
jgi:hypothetical protein